MSRVEGSAQHVFSRFERPMQILCFQVLRLLFLSCNASSHTVRTMLPKVAALVCIRFRTTSLVWLNPSRSKPKHIWIPRSRLSPARVRPSAREIEASEETLVLYCYPDGCNGWSFWLIRIKEIRPFPFNTAWSRKNLLHILAYSWMVGDTARCKSLLIA